MVEGGIGASFISAPCKSAEMAWQGKKKITCKITLHVSHATFHDSGLALNSLVPCLWAYLGILPLIFKSKGNITLFMFFSLCQLHSASGSSSHTYLQWEVLGTATQQLEIKLIIYSLLCQKSQLTTYQPQNNLKNVKHSKTVLHRKKKNVWFVMDFVCVTGVPCTSIFDRTTFTP